MSIRMSSPGGGAPAPQYTPNQIAAMLANPQYRGQAEQLLRSQFGRVALTNPTQRGINPRSDDSGAQWFDAYTTDYTDPTLAAWQQTGDWNAGREGRYRRQPYNGTGTLFNRNGYYQQGDEFSPGRLTGPGGYAADLTPDFRDERGYGRYVGVYDDQGNLTDLQFQKRKLSGGWLSKNMGTWGPLLVGGLAALGTGGFLPGMGGEAAAGGSAATAAPAVTGGMSSIPGSGLTLSGIPVGSSTAAMSYMPGTVGAGLTDLGLIGAGAAGAGAALAPATQAAQAPQAGSMGGAAAPGAGAAPAAGGAGIFDTMKSLATYAGPAASLLSSAQTVGAVNDLQARMPALRGPEVPPVPAARANPEARGYQAASNPITSVLGRNRDANRNRTLLTGPRGVNMESVRVGANTLLGM